MLFILWYDYTPNLYFWQVIKHNFVCLHHFFWKSESDESILSADKNCLTEKDMIEAEKLTAEEAAAELERNGSGRRRLLSGRRALFKRRRI